MNEDRFVHGIVLQLPLPRHLNEEFNLYLNRIDPVKDIDCLNEVNYNRFSVLDNCVGVNVPCVVKSIDLLLERHGIECADRLVVILGKSFLVGCPTRMLFQKRGATVLLCDQYTQNLSRLIRDADILVLGTGNEIRVEQEDIKEGCVVFDIGIRMRETPDGLKVSGDIDHASVS